jgi:hypothetical protein
MDRNAAIAAVQSAEDDIARCSRLLRIVRVFYLAHRSKPLARRLLVEAATLVIDLKRAALRRRQAASEYI